MRGRGGAVEGGHHVRPDPRAPAGYAYARTARRGRGRSARGREAVAARPVLARLAGHVEFCAVTAAVPAVSRLSTVRRACPPDRLVGELVPPPHFAGVRFATYVPDPAPALAGGRGRGALRLRAELTAPPGRRGLFRRTAPPAGPAGVYLDGGFGVGKTHLLASLWYAGARPKAFGTFVEFTNLVGALGFNRPSRRCRRTGCCASTSSSSTTRATRCWCPAARPARRRAGCALAATSNTLPGTLGEGRFAAQDFLREIQGLSARFDVVRIDGEDYRHRGLPRRPRRADDEVTPGRRATAGATLDDFDELLAPPRRGAPAGTAHCSTACGPCTCSASSPCRPDAALRLVVLADRLYDRDIPVRRVRRAARRLFTRRAARRRLPQEVPARDLAASALARAAGEPPDGQCRRCWGPEVNLWSARIASHS